MKLILALLALIAAAHAAPPPRTGESLRVILVGSRPGESFDHTYTCMQSSGDEVLSSTAYVFDGYYQTIVFHHDTGYVDYTYVSAIPGAQDYDEDYLFPPKPGQYVGPNEWWADQTGHLIYLNVWRL